MVINEVVIYVDAELHHNLEFFSPRFDVHIKTEADVPGWENCGIRISCCGTHNEHGLEHRDHVLGMTPAATPLCGNDHEEAKLTHELPGKECSCAHLMLEIMPSTAALAGITKYLWLAADKDRK